MLLIRLYRPKDLALFLKGYASYLLLYLAESKSEKKKNQP